MVSFKKIEHRFQEILLLTMIILAILEFSTILTIKASIIKKLVSLIIMSYFIFKIGPTRLLFNNKHHICDIFIVISYFFLSIKNITSLGFFYDKSGEFTKFISFLKNNAEILDFIGFIIGIVLILIVSVYLAHKIKIYKPSLMEFLKSKKRKNKILDFSEKYVISLLYLLAFFILVFNLFIEWLSWVIDSTIIIITIVIYIFIIVRHHKKYHIESLIFKIGSAGEEFYKKTLNLFHTKKTIFLALLGLLVLHTLTEVNSFIIPYLTGSESLYFETFNQFHQPLIQALNSQLIHNSLTNFQIIITYIANYISILFIMLFPAYLWYKFVYNQKFKFNKIFRITIFTSLLISIINPTFKITKFVGEFLTGVDIQTLTPKLSLLNISFIISIIALLFLFITKNNKTITKIIDKSIILITTLFLTYYVALFLSSFTFYYIKILPIFIKENIIFTLILAIFFIITIAFYITSIYYFIKRVLKFNNYYDKN